jgi:hypothetical protein
MHASTLASLMLAAGLVVAPMTLAAAAPTTETPATSADNPLLTDNGSVRVGKLIGADVYNSQDQKLGSVDGVVVNKNGEPQAVLSVKNKLVEVPWNKLQFGNAQQNSDNKVMLGDMTKSQLDGMQTFRYTSK